MPSVPISRIVAWSGWGLAVLLGVVSITLLSRTPAPEVDRQVASLQGQLELAQDRAEDRGEIIVEQNKELYELRQRLEDGSEKEKPPKPSPDPSPKPTSKPDPKPGGAFVPRGEPDASTQFACEKFRTTARDYSDGILTLPELRDRLKEVDEDAQISSDPDIRATARKMLALVTAGNYGKPMVRAIRTMGKLCDAYGV